MARSIRESYLYKARVSLERSVAEVQKAHGTAPADEEVIEQLLSGEDSIIFDCPLGSAGGRDEVSFSGRHPPQPSPAFHREKLASLFLNGVTMLHI